MDMNWVRFSRASHEGHPEVLITTTGPGSMASEALPGCLSCYLGVRLWQSLGRGSQPFHQGSRCLPGTQSAAHHMGWSADANLGPPYLLHVVECGTQIGASIGPVTLTATPVGQDINLRDRIIL